MASKALEVSLGIVTSVGGFPEIGSIATAGQAGAVFGFQLLWAVVLGGTCIAFLTEQSGRLAAASGLPVAAAIRERFGVPYYFMLLAGIAIVTLLVLAAELGGVCIALEIALAIAYMFAQGLGWNWSEDAQPQRESRFCLTYTIVLLAAGLIALAGPDPLKLTNLSMSLTAATLPIAVVPFLFVMNDSHYLEASTNGRMSNAVVLFSIALAFPDRDHRDSTADFRGLNAHGSRPRLSRQATRRPSGQADRTHRWHRHGDRAGQTTARRRGRSGQRSAGAASGPRVYRWAIALAQRWGLMAANPHRFAFRALARHDKHYRIDKLGSEVPTLAWERWIRKNVMDRIPGS
jgi:hypothetical protein